MIELCYACLMSAVEEGPWLHLVWKLNRPSPVPAAGVVWTEPDGSSYWYA